MEIAPMVYGFETLPGGWKAVVMAYQGSFKTLSGRILDDQIVAAIREAVGKMHEGGWVHGDLRDVNILYCRQETCNKVEIVFVDWDWAGREEEVEYPLTMNMEICRHPDVEPFTLIR